MAPGRPRSLRSMAFNTSRRNSSPARSPSPTFSDATHASAMNFVDGPEKIITRADLKASMQAYEDLMTTSANYRAALMQMSNVTAAFADALQGCSSLKGPSYDAGRSLQAASGLHHVIANHWQVLSDTLDKKFEKPLLQHMDTYRTIVNERSASYERALREKSKVIRDTEASNMNRKERNLQSFREALQVLQRQVDELDELKARHYQEIMEHEEEVWNVVQGKVCIVVRSTMDIFDRFTAKASDPIIEPMLQAVPDPFETYGPLQTKEGQIFSILPPLSIMTGAPSDASSPARSPERDNILPNTTVLHGWLPATTSMTGLSSSTNGISSEWAPASLPTSVSSPHANVYSMPSSSRRPHQPRKSVESKLRSVLTSVEESHALQDEQEDTEIPAPLDPFAARWDNPANYRQFSPEADTVDTTRRLSRQSPTYANGTPPPDNPGDGQSDSEPSSAHASPQDVFVPVLT
ncbi:hypothetical protein FISHEDRAFT_65513 [Fistulina hepatica ATCC 64428]|nr:hypothetical protein FISHEDRAFT_65513 [Fistulina hepatica ATCC 64428]